MIVESNSRLLWNLCSVLQRIRRNLYGSDVDGTAKAGANVGGGCGGSGRASHKNNATIAGESQDDSGALEDDSQRVHRDVDIEGSTGKEGSSNRGHNSLYSDDLSPVNDLHLMIPTDKKSSGYVRLLPLSNYIVC